jgi:hypothetical protein
VEVLRASAEGVNQALFEVSHAGTRIVDLAGAIR